MAETYKQELRGDGRTVAIRIAIEGYGIPKLSIPRIASGRWGPFGLEGTTTTFHVEDGGELVLEVGGIRDATPGATINARDVTPEPLAVEVEGGRLTATQAFLRSIAFDDETDGIKIAVSAHDWEWSTGAVPVAWLALIEGARIERGNLSFHLVRGSRMHAANGGLRLESGMAEWLLIPSPVETKWGKSNDNAIAVIIPAPGRVLDARHVRRALRCLEFALGRHAYVQTLVGVDEKLAPVGALGVEYGRRRQSRVRSPVIASTSQPREQWQPSLFGHLLEYAERVDADDATFLATATYLDALWLHLDGGYLQAQIALEAFCKDAGEKAPPVVRDAGEWNEWVEKHRPEIEALAASKPSAAILMKKVVSAQHGASGDVVLSFFERFGIKLPPEAIEEIKKRGRVAHKFLMSEQTKRDVVRDIRRISIIQTLLAAAVALEIRWKGPIADNRTGERIPAWWPHQERESPHPHLYVCISEAPALPPSSPRVMPTT